jgi:hypothetical protein|tara:strand:- start:160 stop:774 length:615 start_codon:yes stop_codon:yes gene_type:complete
MSLWGKGADAATNKPKNLSTNENSQYKKQDVYATNSGWVQRAGTKASGNDNANATPEVLVAIRGLAGTSASTGLQEATITNLRFIVGTTAATDLSAGSSSQTVLIEITWDEAVTFTGAPVMKVVNSGGGTHDCVYTATGSTANRKRFTVASQTLAANQVLSLGTALHDAVTLPGGATIKDTASGTVNSQRNIPASLRVTHTVTA